MVRGCCADLPAHGLPTSLLDDLASQLRCDEILFEDLDSTRQQTCFAQSLPADGDTADDGLTQGHWQRYWACQQWHAPASTATSTSRSGSNTS